LVNDCISFLIHNFLNKIAHRKNCDRCLTSGDRITYLGTIDIEINKDISLSDEVNLLTIKKAKVGGDTCFQTKSLKKNSLSAT